MEKDKLVKAHKPPYANLPNIWTLPHVRPLTQFFNLQHELDCADLFLTYFSQISLWDTGWTSEELNLYDIDKFGVFYDRRMAFNGKVVLWEVDRDTEPLGLDIAKIGQYDLRERFPNQEKKTSIRDKIGRYLRFADSNSKLDFAVIFTVQSFAYGQYDEQAAFDRFELLQEFLKHARWDNRFFVALHKEVLETPNGAVFISPHRPTEPYTLQQLTELI